MNFHRSFKWKITVNCNITHKHPQRGSISILHLFLLWTSALTKIKKTNFASLISRIFTSNLHHFNWLERVARISVNRKRQAHFFHCTQQNINADATGFFYISLLIKCISDSLIVALAISVTALSPDNRSAKIVFSLPDAWYTAQVAICATNTWFTSGFNLKCFSVERLFVSCHIRSISLNRGNPFWLRLFCVSHTP